MTGKKRTRGREQRERELGTLSDAALPKGTVIKRKTERYTVTETELKFHSTLVLDCKIPQCVRDCYANRKTE